MIVNQLFYTGVAQYVVQGLTHYTSFTECNFTTDENGILYFLLAVRNCQETQHQEYLTPLK